MHIIISYTYNGMQYHNTYDDVPIVTRRVINTYNCHAFNFCQASGGCGDFSNWYDTGTLTLVES